MAEPPRRVLVTGAAGRVGRAVLGLLARQGVAASALDLRDPGDLVADRVVTGRADDPAAVRAALDGVDAVIHLAAIPAPTLGTPEEVFLGNAGGTFVVLEEAGAAGVRRAAVASSFSALGLPWAARALHPAYVPVDEALPLQVEDPYGLSKQVDEATAAMMARRHGMTVVALRYPLLGAPGDRLGARAADYAEDPASGARELWTYLDTRDAARAAWLAIVRPIEGFHVVFATAPVTLAPQPTEDLLARFHPGVERRAPMPGRTAPVDLTAAGTLLGFAAEHLYEPVPAGEAS
ncbi:NAD-dependent epimerase/dehydratase family protein [Microbispora sp. ATCC PTA-5024]|uniref:NAD-dependent epimerase/dehydratase family protein n=1 Tax=Microbispora sp. ATCC PTA-5024 TaxID=316330 RepID=UPI0003DB6E92|nr:NAD(P)-dependent oxidoreductase [Microbispora sp. ATCC PTA-5024]ETK30590.1 epimerase [Microbispora sp. ATCC PTA-5024]